VEAHAAILPCTDEITWILKHVDLENRYTLKTKGEPILLFWEVDIEKHYHPDMGTQKLDEDILNDFKLKVKDLFKVRYEPDNISSIDHPVSIPPRH
jgi:hypothetical protein